MGFARKLIWVLLVVGVLVIIVTNYSFIFSRSVIGRIENVARVTEVTALIGARNLQESQMYSFSVAIRQPDGEMLTATSEDRQWAVAKAGSCVKARFYPYPPWDLNKADTFFNARLVQMADCNSPAAKDMGIDMAQFPEFVAPPPAPTSVPVGTPSADVQN